MTGRDTILCPSAAADERALVLGQVLADGTLAFASRPVTLDADTARELRNTGQAERQFRFAAPCVRSGCKQWAGGRCGVIDEVMAVRQPVTPPPQLPRCLIRANCRWFRQRGADACRICRFVVTNNTPEPEAPHTIAPA